MQTSWRFTKIMAMAVAAVGLLAVWSVPSQADVARVNGAGMAFNIQTNTTSSGDSASGAIDDAGYGYTLTNTTSTEFFSGSYTPFGGTATTTTSISYTTTYYVTTTVPTFTFLSSYTYQTSTASGNSYTLTTFYSSTNTDVTVNDAYDGYNALRVNCPSGGGWFTGNGFATYENNGREVIMGPQTICGLNVRRKVFVPSGQPWVRHLNILSNPTANPITVTVSIFGELGSDSSTQIVRTQSGDRSAAAGADRWVVTTQIGCCDPHLSHNIDGPGGSRSAQDINFGKFVDRADWTWGQVTIPAGGRKILATFAGAHMTIGDAISVARAIDATPGSLVKGMTDSEIADVINWALKRAEEAAATGNDSDCVAVRTPMAASQAAANGAILLLPLIGFAVLRRRRRR